MIRPELAMIRLGMIYLGRPRLVFGPFFRLAFWTSYRTRSLSLPLTFME
jgi:hypothetical protein